MPTEKLLVLGGRDGALCRPLVLDSSTDRTAQRAIPTTERFTIDGSDELETQLSGLCERARGAVEEAIPKSKLDGMLLGGGYGRGEGGVLQTSAGERPYNDLEFYVFVKGPTLLSIRKFQPVLDHHGHELSEEAGLEIELRATSFSKLRHTPVNMFYYDLVMGHRWTIGDEKLLAGCEHHRRADQIPISEATHLLMNRCSGLLFARQRLEQSAFSPEDADFVERNIAKAKLALGDVILTAYGQYHWSCRERHRLLMVLATDAPSFRDVQRLHAEGVEFKLHPHQSGLSTSSLRQMFEPVSALALKMWLWVESRRLRTIVSSAEEYAFLRKNKCAKISAWKNALVNVRAFRARALSPKLFRHPRERLFNSLPLLLWAGGDSQPVGFLQRELLAEKPTMESLLIAYRNLWRRCN